MSEKNPGDDRRWCLRWRVILFGWWFLHSWRGRATLFGECVVDSGDERFQVYSDGCL